MQQYTPKPLIKRLFLMTYCGVVFFEKPLRGSQFSGNTTDFIPVHFLQKSPTSINRQVAVFRPKNKKRNFSTHQTTDTISLGGGNPPIVFQKTPGLPNKKRRTVRMAQHPIPGSLRPFFYPPVSQTVCFNKSFIKSVTSHLNQIYRALKTFIRNATCEGGLDKTDGEELVKNLFFDMRHQQLFKEKYTLFYSRARHLFKKRDYVAMVLPKLSADRFSAPNALLAEVLVQPKQLSCKGTINWLAAAFLSDEQLLNWADHLDTPGVWAFLPNALFLDRKSLIPWIQRKKIAIPDLSYFKKLINAVLRGSYSHSGACHCSYKLLIALLTHTDCNRLGLDNLANLSELLHMAWHFFITEHTALFASLAWPKKAFEGLSQLFENWKSEASLEWPTYLRLSEDLQRLVVAYPRIVASKKLCQYLLISKRYIVPGIRDRMLSRALTNMKEKWQAYRVDHIPGVRATSYPKEMDTRHYYWYLRKNKPHLFHPTYEKMLLNNLFKQGLLENEIKRLNKKKIFKSSDKTPLFDLLYFENIALCEAYLQKINWRISFLPTHFLRRVICHLVSTLYFLKTKHTYMVLPPSKEVKRQVTAQRLKPLIVWAKKLWDRQRIDLFNQTNFIREHLLGDLFLKVAKVCHTYPDILDHLLSCLPKEMVQQLLYKKKPIKKLLYSPSSILKGFRTTMVYIKHRVLTYTDETNLLMIEYPAYIEKKNKKIFIRAQKQALIYLLYSCWLYKERKIDYLANKAVLNQPFKLLPIETPLATDQRLPNTIQKILLDYIFDAPFPGRFEKCPATQRLVAWVQDLVDQLGNPASCCYQTFSFYKELKPFLVKLIQGIKQNNIGHIGSKELAGFLNELKKPVTDRRFYRVTIPWPAD